MGIFTNNSISYLEKLSHEAQNISRIENIKKTIDEKGIWEDYSEWRISTVTESKIKPIIKDNKTLYEVKVKCDSEYICHCPTIERAVEFAGIYERLVQDLFWTVGWPSWEKPNQR